MKALVTSSPLLRAVRLLFAAGLAWTVLAALAAGDLAARRTAALADEPGSSSAAIATGAPGVQPPRRRLAPHAPPSRRKPARAGRDLAERRNGRLQHHLARRRRYARLRCKREGPPPVGERRRIGSRAFRRREMACLLAGQRWDLDRADGRPRPSPPHEALRLRGLRLGAERTFRGAQRGRGDDSQGRMLERISVLPLRGKRRIVARMGENTGQHADHDGAAWSPDGRWIAYLNLEDNNGRSACTSSGRTARDSTGSFAARSSRWPGRPTARNSHSSSRRGSPASSEWTGGG